MICLTGASGFLGYHLSAFLTDNGYNLVAPVRKESVQKQKVRDLKNRGVIIVEGDFFEQETLKDIFKFDIDIVIHLAAIRGETDCSDDEYMTVNVAGTKTLLEESKKNNVTKFIYCSMESHSNTCSKYCAHTKHICIKSLFFCYFLN